MSIASCGRLTVSWRKVYCFRAGRIDLKIPGVEIIPRERQASRGLFGPSS
ncbi:MAG TPA: hypothetical protein VFS10_04910 [Pyrinomonadaceae bacterium]|nr:hypothetical protein [Pyrinomonadaceae bacterium]